MALTPKESSVLNLHDQGHDIAQISAALSLKPGTVKEIVRKFSDNDGPFEDRIRSGTDRLLQRIIRVHPERGVNLCP